MQNASLPGRDPSYYGPTGSFCLPLYDNAVVTAQLKALFSIVSDELKLKPLCCADTGTTNNKNSKKTENKLFMI